jgi:hypothetical protein
MMTIPQHSADQLRGLELGQEMELNSIISLEVEHLSIMKAHSLIHLVYDYWKTNRDRENCRRLATRLRLNGDDVPVECEQHEPVYLLQHAALTPYESCLIQFSILRKAHGLPPLPPPMRPLNHPYPTFEYEVPLSMQFVEGGPFLDEDDLVEQRIVEIYNENGSDDGNGDGNENGDNHSVISISSSSNNAGNFSDSSESVVEVQEPARPRARGRPGGAAPARAAAPAPPPGSLESGNMGTNCGHCIRKFKGIRAYWTHLVLEHEESGFSDLPG